MGKICKDCVHLRLPRRPETSTGGPPRDSAMLQVLLQEEHEGNVRKAIEGAAVQKTSLAPLDGPPKFHAWCDAKSRLEQGKYFFEVWQTTEYCEAFQNVKFELDDRVDKSSISSGDHPAVQHFAKPTTEEFDVYFGDPIAVEQTTTSSGPNSEAFDFRVADDPGGPVPAISASGLYATYMIFGGPGAGKTVLYKHLLGQILAHPAQPGCLLLNPKGDLHDWVLAQGRPPETCIFVERDTTTPFNILGTGLGPRELGRLLSDVVMAEAGDVQDAWQIYVSQLLESAVTVLMTASRQALTIRLLLSQILRTRTYKFADGSRRQLYPIQVTASELLRLRKQELNQDVRDACQSVASFFKVPDRDQGFVRQLIDDCLGELRSEKWDAFSQNGPLNVYDMAIHHGGIILVAIDFGSARFQRSVQTLMKAIFQRYVLRQLAEHQLHDRFMVLACDEYAHVVTEGASGLVSDSSFFSQSRQAGCLTLVALQSVATARSRFPAAMKDRWESIMGNVSGKIFMRLNDVETAQLASNLVGTRIEKIRYSTSGSSSQGLTEGDSYTFLERPKVPASLFLSALPTFYGLAHGTFDGMNPISTFFRAPKPGGME